MVKDPATPVAAYDDGRGVTAEFNRNVLTVLNSRLRRAGENLRTEVSAEFRPQGVRAELGYAGFAREHLVHRGGEPVRVSLARAV